VSQPGRPAVVLDYKDMLDLIQDEGFRTQYPQLTILNPVALLQALAPLSEGQL